jgi:hypothetical protein
MRYCCSWFIAAWQLPLLCCGRFCDQRVFTHSVATPNKGKRTSEFFIYFVLFYFILFFELFKNKLEVVATVVTVRAVM